MASMLFKIACDPGAFFSLALVFPSFIIQIQFSFLSKWYCRCFFFSSFLDFHWNFGWRTPSHHIYVYATYRSKLSCRFASLYIDGFVNESWIYSRSVFFSASEQISQEWNETNGIKLLEKVSISFCFVTGFNVMRCSSFCAHFVTI